MLASSISSKYLKTGSMDTSAKIEQYFSEAHQFKEAIGLLRILALKTNMEETFKWMFPTYTLAGKNVIAICKFKNHFGIWFFNGVFLSDPHGVLENAQEGKTQAMRQWKFYASEEINKTKVLAYINEAIENQQKGIKLVPKKKEAVNVVVPALLKDALSKNSAAKEAFEKLSPYNKKEYSEYIANAKREKTKQSRLDTILRMILEGKGLHYMYK